MISPLSGTLSKKIFFSLFCKQNIIRDIETNNLTVTRGEVGGNNVGNIRKGLQEHLKGTHGQNQGQVRSVVGGGVS